MSTSTYLHHELEIVSVLNKHGVVRLFGIDIEDEPNELTLRNYDGDKFHFIINHKDGVKALTLEEYDILGLLCKNNRLEKNKVFNYDPSSFFEKLNLTYNESSRS